MHGFRGSLSVFRALVRPATAVGSLWESKYRRGRCVVYRSHYGHERECCVPYEAVIFRILFSLVMMISFSGRAGTFRFESCRKRRHRLMKEV